MILPCSLLCSCIQSIKRVHKACQAFRQVSLSHNLSYLLRVHSSVKCMARPQLEDEDEQLDSTWNSKFRTSNRCGVFWNSSSVPHCDDKPCVESCLGYQHSLWSVKIINNDSEQILYSWKTEHDKHHGESQIYMYSSWSNVIRRSILHIKHIGPEAGTPVPVAIFMKSVLKGSRVIFLDQRDDRWQKSLNNQIGIWNNSAGHWASKYIGLMHPREQKGTEWGLKIHRQQAWIMLPSFRH